MTIGTSMIDFRDDILGGKAIIRGTRVPVWILVKARVHYGTLDAMAEDYPSAGREGIEAALVYYESHRAEIDEQIARAAQDAVSDDNTDDGLLDHPAP